MLAPFSVLDVPYFSQWESPQLVPSLLDGSLAASADPRWRESGAASADEYEFWSWRSCGVACLRMMLTYWYGKAEPAMCLVKECVEAGAYVVHEHGVDGMIYRPFSDYLASRWGLHAQVEESLAAKDVAEWIGPNQLAIISVHPSIRQPIEPPPARGGHLVLVVGRGTDSLVLHNPSGLPGESQAFAEVSFDVLEEFGAGRGMLISKTD